MKILGLIKIHVDSSLLYKSDLLFNIQSIIMFHRLFRKPPYCGLFLDLSLLLTRCKDTTEQMEEEIDEASFTENLRQCPPLFA